MFVVRARHIQIGPAGGVALDLAVRTDLVVVVVAAHEEARPINGTGDELQILNRQIAAANGKLDLLLLALLSQARAVNPARYLITHSQHFHIDNPLILSE